MTTSVIILIAGALLTLAGLVWALPWGRDRRRAPGWVLVASGLLMMASLFPPVGSLLAQGLLWGMTVVTLGSAVAMITTARPVYSALWFGMSVLGTAGLVLYHGAGFVSMALIVVYIGAILVVFLFLLMLDEPQGRTSFNRQSWEPVIASVAGVLLIGLVTAACVESLHAGVSAEQAGIASEGGVAMTPAVTPTRTAELGGRMFGQYALAIEALGILLLLALVGATVIIARPLEPLLDLRPVEPGEGWPVVEWMP